MDHVAIMNKKQGLIDRILSGKKTIETRWYKNKSIPWDKICVGDRIFFKDSGASVRAMAEVKKVRQYENLNIKMSQKIVDEYGDEGLIDIQNKNAEDWASGKRYAILIWLKNVKAVKAFSINKKGFGSASAWISINNIDIIKAV
jgi:ASC-1-like (ASCH) protein